METCWIIAQNQLNLTVPTRLEGMETVLERKSDALRRVPTRLEGMETDGATLRLPT